MTTRDENPWPEWFGAALIDAQIADQFELVKKMGPEHAAKRMIAALQKEATLQDRIKELEDELRHALRAIEIQRARLIKDAIAVVRHQEGMRQDWIMDDIVRKLKALVE
jgi:hypothetical protein